MCDKRYAFAWQLKHHAEACGKIWSCLSCDKTYSERLSLVIHCKRHAHVLPDDARGWRDRKKKKQAAPAGIVLLPILIAVPIAPAHERVILPKAPLTAAAGLSVATQTPLTEMCAGKDQPGRKRKAERQAGTQTEKKKRSTSAQCPPIRYRTSNRKRGLRVTESIKTQTMESILYSACITSPSLVIGHDEPANAPCQYCLFDRLVKHEDCLQLMSDLSAEMR